MWSTYDVLEPILLQVAVKLFKVNRLRLLLPRPDVTTLITVNSVCRDWWEVITGRKVIKRRLKLTFRKVCFLRWDIQRVCLSLSFSVDIHHPWPHVYFHGHKINCKFFLLLEYVTRSPEEPLFGISTLLKSDWNLVFLPMYYLVPQPLGFKLDWRPLLSNTQVLLYLKLFNFAWTSGYILTFIAILRGAEDSITAF